EVGVKVALRVAAAEFDDREGLAGAVVLCREVVRRADLDRRVRGGRRRRGREAEIRAGLWAVVDAEDRGHHSGQRVRQVQLSGAVAVHYSIRGERMRAAYQRDGGAECVGER